MDPLRDLLIARRIPELRKIILINCGWWIVYLFAVVILIVPMVILWTINMSAYGIHKATYKIIEIVGAPVYGIRDRIRGNVQKALKIVPHDEIRRRMNE